MLISEVFFFTMHTTWDQVDLGKFGPRSNNVERLIVEGSDGGAHFVENGRSS